MEDEKESNLRRVEECFRSELRQVGYAGVLGVASFGVVYRGLMLVQRARLEEICGARFEDLKERGSIVCIGVAYPEHVVDCIGAESGGVPDKDA